MDAIGEQSLTLFSAERVLAEPDLTALVRDYSGLLYRVALSLVRNAAEAEDVVQDVFVRVLQRQGELNGIVEVRPWLVRIAWNLAIDRTRKVRPDQMDDPFAAGLLSREVPVDEALKDASRMQQVLKAIERLPKHERQALLLSAMEELSNAEIAAVMGKSESSVRSLIFRARTRLRGQIRD
ncbi:MAG TPA: sigma-70 family RNA polymerase sigma factor [Acidobacteriaceae bacterium]|jgi:RNA polymerase sigma-70 factor (ECF subfamily)|nr:sigma-70 family RNA polymerase sigma factor [Acidobacteriaceae bacterium]